MLKLSDEALGAVMLALQNSLMEQSDIVPVLKGFDFKVNEAGHLFVINPPLVKAGYNDEDEYPIDDGSEQVLDLNKQEIKIIYNFINKFLRQFETSPREEKFWDKIYSVSELKKVRDKLKMAMKNA